jgi:hypothetical protein
MKKPLNNIPIFVMLALLSVTTTFTSCKDDKKDDEPQLPKTYRMKTIDFTAEGDTYKNQFTYTADNKIERLAEFENGVEVYRSNWAWNGNEVTITEQSLNGGVWVGEASNEKLIYSGGHLTESQYYNEGLLTTKTNYTWNGNLLTSEVLEFHSGDTLTWSYNINYVYEGTKLVRADWFAFGMLIQKQVIEYLNGTPVALKTYDYSNVLEESSQLIYTGDKITTINSFHVVEGVQGDISCTETRVYDGNKCATDITTTCTDDYSYTSKIAWEEGSGNFNDYLLTQVSWISVYLFPDTFPCELAYKKKK